MLAVVVLTYRPAAGMLEACLESVLASGDADVVVLVDNGGAVASGTARVPDDPRVEVLVMDDNRGYAGGMNAGVRRALDAGADVVGLLNDDTVVRPGWLATLAAGLDGASRVGAVQPKLLLAGTDPPRLNSAGVRVRADGAGIDIGHGEIDAGQYDRPGWISAFTGGAVALSRSMLLDVGGFDERYFMYYEDLDLARRAAAAGWRFRYDPAAVVEHAWSASSSAVPDQRRFWQERNRLWFLIRHESFVHVVRGLGLSAARLAKMLSVTPKRGRGALGAQARAILAGLRATPTLLRERHRPPHPVTPVTRSQAEYRAHTPGIRPENATGEGGA